MQEKTSIMLFSANWNSVTLDNCSTSFGNPCDAKMLLWWQNFQSTPRNKQSVVNVGQYLAYTARAKNKLNCIARITYSVFAQVLFYRVKCLTIITRDFSSTYNNISLMNSINTYQCWIILGKTFSSWLICHYLMFFSGRSCSRTR